jgi:hypothetical protein
MQGSVGLKPSATHGEDRLRGLERDGRRQARTMTEP